MIGVVGALVALAVVLAIVLVLVVRQPARRLDRAVAGLRTDVTARLALLHSLQRAGRARRGPAAESEATPSATAVAPSPIGGRGRHRRVDGAP